MRSIGILLVVAAVALPAPAPASAVPSGAVLELDVLFDCMGCGPTAVEITGTVLGGAGDLRSGDAVTGGAYADEPTAGCPAIGTASGVLTSESGYDRSFNWSRVGATVVMTTNDGGTGSGTFVPTGPAGNACGAGVTARLTGALRYESTRPADPSDGFAITAEMARRGLGTITISDTGSGPQYRLDGSLALPDSTRDCRTITDATGVGVECYSRNSRLRCARISASAVAVPMGERLFDPFGPLEPAYWGGQVSTTATCVGVRTVTVTTPTARLGQQVTGGNAGGPGASSTFRCIARLSDTGPAQRPRAPYVSRCYMLA